MDEFDILDEHDETMGPDVDAPTPPPHDTTTTLHRSATKRVFGGVAGGIAERFDIDANIVRVVFVVLALVYGLGIALYLAMWVLIPSAPSSGEVVAEPVEDAPRVRWLRYALPLAIVVLAVIFIATIHSVPNLGKAFSLVWLIFLVLLAVIALFSPARRLTFRRLVALAFLGFISLLIVLTGAVLLTLQVIGVPVQGGSGTRQWAPTTMSEVLHDYHGAFGETTLDLSHVAFTGTTSVTVTQGIGKLLVEVPDDVTVDLRTHVGIGNVNNYYAGPSVSGTVARTPGANLVLNLEVGIGEIQLVHIVGNQS
ncbi:MAG: PspC domain-containing protein [Acidimicrobiales bacterium]|jgi:phage shock protein PspC (stress-responsive transcriptional regulator)